jgi:hypothetical protein
MMVERPGFWECAGAGMAVGGTGAWGLSAAARTGVLRALLDVFPRSSWDTVTWGLIPALLLAPPVLQGLVVAWSAGARPLAVVRGIAGSLVGTLVAAAVFGIAVLDGIPALPADIGAAVARVAPEVLVPGFVMLLVTGWLLLAGRVPGLSWLRWWALPLSASAMFVAWVHDRERVLFLVSMLDRPEFTGFFASVAVGGSLVSAWAVDPRRPRKR